MIIYKYILKNHFAPFFFSVFILFAVLLVNYLMKMADKLVGKGLDFLVIVQVIVYSLSFMLVLVIPMAVLVTTLMAFGSMSQNNEIAIMKASGISLYKMILPPLLSSIVIAFLLVQFNNNVYPNTNHALRILLNDISRTKPTLSLVPGIFSQEVQNYSILAREIDQETNELKDVTIYDYSSSNRITVLTAKTGLIYFSSDRKKLLLDLFFGEIHESNRYNNENYRKLYFEKHKIAMDAEQFSFEQRTPGSTRSDRELSAQAMIEIVDSIDIIKTNEIDKLTNKVEKFILSDSMLTSDANSNHAKELKFTFVRTRSRINHAQNNVVSLSKRIKNISTNMNEYWVEIHKKYSLPVAAIVFVLIGVPLGTMIRKGGFGMSAGVSLIFFLVYWAFLIGGEKLADRDLLSPSLGMWSANILLGALGIILTIKSAKEQVTISFEFFKKLLPKQWR